MPLRKSIQPPFSLHFIVFIFLWSSIPAFTFAQQNNLTSQSNFDPIPVVCFLSPTLTDYSLTKRDNEPIQVLVATHHPIDLAEKAFHDGIDIDLNQDLIRPGFLKCQLNKKEIALLSSFSEVRGIELIRQAKPELKQEGLDLSLNEINVIHARRPGLQGTDLLVSIKEYGFDLDDIDFKGRYVETLLPTRTDMHSTSMASICGGGGNSDPSALGVAFDASLTSSDYGVLLPDPDSIFTLHGISVQNHSYGTGIENYYGMETVAYDEFCNRLPKILHVFASGNQENNSSTSGIYEGIQGWANLSGQYKQSKNTITVGSVDSMDLKVSFSSSGPAYDGRIKPEVVLFGPGGTSNASALLSGTTILLQNAYQQLHTGAFPTSSLLKAIFINTAKDLDTPGPDFRKGFGSVRAQEALKTIEENRFIEDTIWQGENKDIAIQIPANTAFFSLTIAWNDPAASLDASKALVNDLDIQLVQNTTQTKFYPWILNSKAAMDSLSLPALHGVDTLNNIERIDVEIPVAGEYTIRISGQKIITENQAFSLTWGITPFEQFSWTFPTGSDILENGTSYLARWKSNASTSGKLAYKSTDSIEWQMISPVVDPKSEKWKWISPTVNGLYQLRFTIQDSVYLTDTFVVSSQVMPTVGLVCPDSVLIYWNRIPGADGYEILILGERHLEHHGETSDTVYVFHHLSSAPTLFAVVPLFQQHKGLSSPTFNYKNLDVSCYLNNFYLREIKDGKGIFQVDIGWLVNVKALHLEEYSELGFSEVATISPVTQLSNIMEGKPLHQGINYYRAVLELTNGYTITSDTESVYYLEDSPALVFPNPSYSGEEIHILSRSIESFDLKIMDMTGREIILVPHADNPTIMTLPSLPPGVYIAVFHFETGETEAERFMIR